MKHVEKIRSNTLRNVKQFGLDNTGDFPAGSVGAAQFAEIDAVLGLLDRLAAQQTGGLGAAETGFIAKDTARESLRESLGVIVRTARAMEHEFPGISEKFRRPRGTTDQQLLAAASVLIAPLETHRLDFIRYGLGEDFLADFREDLADFQSSYAAPATARHHHVSATAEIAAAIRRGMIAMRILDGVVKNTYRSDVGKLAAWTAAMTSSLKKRQF